MKKIERLRKLRERLHGKKTPPRRSSSRDAQPPEAPRNTYSDFLATLTREGTYRAYQGDLQLFARWLGLEPEGAADVLVRSGEARGTELVQRWLAELRGASVSVRNRRLAALKALVKFAQGAGLCSWSLQIAGESKQPAPARRTKKRPLAEALVRIKELEAKLQEVVAPKEELVPTLDDLLSAAGAVGDEELPALKGLDPRASEEKSK